MSPTTLTLTPYDVARRFLGVREVPGVASNPLVLAMLRLDQDWPADDSVPWCSAFTNFVAWLLGLERSRSLAARSWLTVGTPVPLEAAVRGDVVVLTRGAGKQPGPEVTSGAPGHVGFFDRLEGDRVYLLGGNQGNAVTVAPFARSRVLGVRRLGPEGGRRP